MVAVNAAPNNNRPAIVPMSTLLCSLDPQIVLCLLLLYECMGVSIFAGLAIMILLIPLNMCIVSRIRQLQVGQMGMKVVCLHRVSGSKP
jgi:hypothetical protein